LADYADPVSLLAHRKHFILYYICLDGFKIKRLCIPNAAHQLTKRVIQQKYHTRLSKLQKSTGECCHSMLPVVRLAKHHSQRHHDESIHRTCPVIRPQHSQPF